MDEKQSNPDPRQRFLAETEALFARYRSVPKVTKPTVRPKMPDTLYPTPPRQPAAAAHHTEITVDLPHGQSLTVRGLEPGAIVEIASWTGTGPPDSDAVRMMFGATRPQTAAAAVAPTGNPTTSSSTSSSSDEIDIEGEQPADSTPDTVDKDDSTRKARPMWKRLGITAAVIGLIAVIIAGLRFTGIASFEHPDGGLTGGLGSAESTFVAISPSASIEPNASVLVTVDGENLIAGVIQVGPDDVLVFTGDGQQVVDSADVLGRVLFVVPFIGYLAG